MVQEQKAKLLNFSPPDSFNIVYHFNFHFIGVGYAGVVNVRYMAMAHEPGI